MSQFTCPITKTTMTDPVICQDGHTYNRSAILEWFKNNDTSPMTGEKISKVLITNHVMRSELLAAGGTVKSLNTVPMASIDKEKSIRIALVLDVSGSMDTSVENKKTNEPSFSRLDLIKHAVSSIAAMMRESDQLSIVVFSDNARLIWPWTKMDATQKDSVHELSKNLHTEGGTNISAGVELGVAQGADHTILLTDGANTVGAPLRGTLADHIIGKISNYSGKIHSVGLGMAYDLDTPTLRAVSLNKGGLYCFCPDASMVGTIFIHLMANICVHEPGTPFQDHAKFIETIVRAASTKDVELIRRTKFDDPILNEDLVSTDDNKGQVEKAILNWDTWGRHYLPAFIDAHMHCMTTNFKDASIQGYATPNTRAFIDAGEVTFLGITPPIPSCNNYVGVGYTAVQFATTSLHSQGICFGPDTELTIVEGAPHPAVRNIKIKDIKKGMLVNTGTNWVFVRCLVVSPETEMINLNGDGSGFWVSRNHPLIKFDPKHSNENWSYAETFKHESIIQVHKCYNLVLESNHVVNIYNDKRLPIFKAVTLGHGKTSGILAHYYLGTDRIINDLSKAPGWEKGLVEIKSLKRNSSGFICGIEV